jgi:hypothetical protein
MAAGAGHVPCMVFRPLSSTASKPLTADLRPTELAGPFQVLPPCKPRRASGRSTLQGSSAIDRADHTWRPGPFTLASIDPVDRAWHGEPPRGALIDRVNFKSECARRNVREKRGSRVCCDTAPAPEEETRGSYRLAFPGTPRSDERRRDTPIDVPVRLGPGRTRDHGTSVPAAG